MYNAVIKLVRKTGFNWSCADGVSFKGYVFSGGGILKGETACRYIKELMTVADDTAAKLRKINGIFAFVYQSPEKTVLCSDRTRTFPLFYTTEAGPLLISDDPSELKSAGKKISANSVQAFLSAGYVPGSGTLLENISQVQAGEYITYSPGGLKKEFYHSFGAGELNADVKSLKNELMNALTDAGRRLAVSLEGKYPVLPLSSGYDSRLIAVLLKMNGFDDVFTFTYGRKDNYEASLSAKTAEILKYKWTNIEYGPETVRDFIRSENFLKYYPLSSSYSSMFFLQEFFAVEKLKKEIPENSVLIPGHSGDSVAGSHLKNKMAGIFSKNELIDIIISGHFIHKRTDSGEFKNLKDIIGAAVEDKKEYSYQDYQNWIIKERHAKFIINSNRIYEFFGFEHRMPLVDGVFLDVMEKMPFDLKCGKKIYDEVLREYFFEPYGLNFSGETNPTENTLRVQDVKNTIKHILPKKIVDIYKERIKVKADTYFNIGVTDEMIKDMRKDGYEPDMTGENRNSIIIQWYIHQLLNERF